MEKGFKQVGVFIGWGIVLLLTIILVFWTAYIFPTFSERVGTFTSYFGTYDENY